MAFFQNSVINKYIQNLDKQTLQNAYAKFRAHFHNATIQENIRGSKEEQYQGEFLIDLFVNVLGYTKNPTPNFNLTTEYKNVKDSKKADGAIIINDIVKAVIELKGTNTTDLNKIEVQAFGYKNNQPECEYVITSNFEKIRFYIDNAIEYTEFNLFTLTEKEFELLYICLSYDSIAKGLPKQIKDESVSQESLITKKLYNDYSQFKNELYHSLVKLNPQYEPLELFKKSQKLLDRFLFIFFAEDRQLLPTNLIFRINKEWQQLRNMRIEVSLYDRYKIYFNDLDCGATVSLPAFSQTASKQVEEFQIYAYNGGLFKKDDLLNDIKIEDELLFAHTEKLSNYDFASEVDVNVLGHIFENSLNDVDEIKAQLEGQEIDKTKTKRKKDGVFYTPKYITKYIVDNTVGKLCLEKKEALELTESDYTIDKKRQKKTTQALTDKLNEYRNWLLQLTICDPACGSGAFLNQALDFLITEHKYIDELQAKLFGDALVLSDVEGSILENNLFGVDINEESVEIAKLSLWLRTAQPNRKLNDLNSNIKCGNSLIDDIDVAGDNAFNWENEFKEIFANGGFDIIIGNPPWGAKLNSEDSEFLLKKYPLVPSKLKDSYLYFMLLALDLLKNKGGYGLIVPNTWLLINNTAAFRQHLLSFDIIEINDHGDGVFDDAIVESATLILRKVGKIDGNVKAIRSKKNMEVLNHIVDKTNWLKDPLFRIVLELNKNDIDIFNKVELISSPFSESSDIIFGIKPYQVGHGTPSQTREMVNNRIYHSNVKHDESWKELVVGTDVRRYSLNYVPNTYIKYGKVLMYASDETKIKNTKILLRRTSHDLKAVIDSSQFYPQNSIFIITSKYCLEYILCLLNSKLFDYIYKAKCPQEGKIFAEVKPSIIKSLPIANVSGEEQNSFKKIVTEIISLNKNLLSVSSKFATFFSSKYKIANPSSKLEKWFDLDFSEFIKEINKSIKASKGELLTKKDEFDWIDLFEENKKKALELKSKIDATDKEIDQMVYKIYNLTEEEIKIVEGN